MSGCFQCGSSEGSAFQLCPTCIAERNQQRAAKMSAVKAADSPAEESDVVYVAFNNLPFQLAASFTLVTLLFVIFTFSGPLVGQGAAASFLFSLMSASGLIATLILLFFWARMLVHEPIWGIVTIFFPGFAYRYVVLRWSDADIRRLTFLHLGGAVFALLAGALLAALLSTSFIDVLMLYHLYFRGLGLPLTAP